MSAARLRHPRYGEVGGGNRGGREGGARDFFLAECGTNGSLSLARTQNSGTAEREVGNWFPQAQWEAIRAQDGISNKKKLG